MGRNIPTYSGVGGVYTFVFDITLMGQDVYLLCGPSFTALQHALNTREAYISDAVSVLDSRTEASTLQAAQCIFLGHGTWWEIAETTEWAKLRELLRLTAARDPGLI